MSKDTWTLGAQTEPVYCQASYCHGAACVTILKESHNCHHFHLEYLSNGRSVDFLGACLVWGHCRQPPHCVPETYTNATSWYKVFTTVRDSDTKYSQDYNPFWCYKGAIGKVYHTLNPKLTVIVPDVSCLSRTDASELFLILFRCSSHKLLVLALKPVSSTPPVFVPSQPVGTTFYQVFSRRRTICITSK